MHINGATAWRAVPARMALPPWNRWLTLGGLAVAFPLWVLFVLVDADGVWPSYRLPAIVVLSAVLGALVRSIWSPFRRWSAGGFWDPHPRVNSALRRLRAALEDGADERAIVEMVAANAVEVLRGRLCFLTLSSGAKVQADALGVQWHPPHPTGVIPIAGGTTQDEDPPLMAQLSVLGELLGTLEIWPRPGRPFGALEERLLDLYAAEAGVALKNASLLSTTHSQAAALQSKIAETEWWQSQLDLYVDDLARTSEQLSEARSILEETYMETLETLASAVDARDPSTYGHCRRVADLSVALAKEMGVSEADRRALHRAALLHDIGKLGVPDATLRKPTALTGEDETAIRQHPELGYRMLSGLRFLGDALPTIRYHHERFDGTGYPYGLKGERIPLLARILAVADAYDAITSDRPYRSGQSSGAGIAEMIRCAGTDFDPAVVTSLVRALSQAA